MLKSRVVTDFPLCDQELLLRICTSSSQQQRSSNSWSQEREIGHDRLLSIVWVASSGVAVLEGVLLERHRCQLLLQPLARRLGGHEVQVGLEEVLVHHVGQ